MLRPVMLLCRLRHVRKMAGGLLAAVWEVGGTFILLNYMVVFFGVCAFVMLSSNGTQRLGSMRGPTHSLNLFYQLVCWILPSDE